MGASKTFDPSGREISKKHKNRGNEFKKLLKIKHITF